MDSILKIQIDEIKRGYDMVDRIAKIAGFLVGAGIVLYIFGAMGHVVK